MKRFEIVNFIAWIPPQSMTVLDSLVVPGHEKWFYVYVFTLFLIIVGLFAAIFSFSHCGIQRYRRQKDWVSQYITYFPHLFIELGFHDLDDI